MSSYLIRFAYLKVQYVRMTQNKQTMGSISTV